MPAELLTTDDLREFKEELLSEFNQLLQKLILAEPKRYLKSSEARKLLGLSPNTLLKLRVEGIIPYSKINGIIYFDRNEIVAMMEKHRQ